MKFYMLFFSKCIAYCLKKRNKLGDLILPIAAIRGEGTSNDYFPPEVPALPAFALQRAVSTTIRENKVDYWTGTVYTTNRRIWEHSFTAAKYTASDVNKLSRCCPIRRSLPSSCPNYYFPANSSFIHALNAS